MFIFTCRIHPLQSLGSRDHVNLINNDLECRSNEENDQFTAPENDDEIAQPSNMGVEKAFETPKVIFDNECFKNPSFDSGYLIF